MMQWIDYNDMKEASPIELADYALANWIADKPAFTYGCQRFKGKGSRLLANLRPSTGE